MNRMYGLAGTLLVVMAVAIGIAWLARSDVESTQAKAAGFVAAGATITFVVVVWAAAAFNAHGMPRAWRRRRQADRDYVAARLREPLAQRMPTEATDKQERSSVKNDQA